MKPTVRQQLEDADTRASYGDRCVIACTVEEDRTRQEFRDTVDVNTIIRNVTGHPFREPEYGNVDFDSLDRQTIENQMRAASELYDSLSPELRASIGSPAVLVEMAAQGWQPPAVPTPVAPPQQ